MKFIVIICAVLVTLSGSGQGIPGNFVTVSPRAGDSWPYLQTMVKSCITKGIKNIYFKKGNYYTSRPLLIEDSGRFVSLNLIGEPAAHFNLEKSEARIIYTADTGAAIQYQLARSSKIKGLVIYGNGVRQDEQFKVYAGISIDPYYRGTTSGSSGILIEECRIRGFTAGIIISQNGVTLNAENIHVENCSIDGVKVAYATCQRQSKENTVKNLICWDNTHTVFDGASYGQRLGVMPYIDGANIAGSVYQVFNYGPQLFATSAQKIFAETITRVGTITDGGTGVTIRDSHFDFSWSAFPASHFKGNNITFDNVSMRYYDDLNNKRIIIDGVDNSFLNGYADLPFLMKNTDKEENHRTNYYYNYRCIPGSKTRTVAHTELERFYWLDQQYLDVENARIVVNRPHNARVGDYLDAGHPFYIFARIKDIKGDTLYLDCITEGTKTEKLHLGINGLK